MLANLIALPLVLDRIVFFFCFESLDAVSPILLITVTFTLSSVELDRIAAMCWHLYKKVVTGFLTTMTILPLNIITIHMSNPLIDIVLSHWIIRLVKVGFSQHMKMFRVLNFNE